MVGEWGGGGAWQQVWVCGAGRLRVAVFLCSRRTEIAGSWAAAALLSLYFYNCLEVDHAEQDGLGRLAERVSCAKGLLADSVDAGCRSHLGSHTVREKAGSRLCLQTQML